MIKFCSMLICNDFVDIVAFSYISISFYCISIYVCLHYLHVNVTCLYHPTIQSEFIQFFVQKTSRIFQLFIPLGFLFPLNNLFLTFLHRHDFDVLLTNLIDVSDIIVRNGRQISAVDLGFHWNFQDSWGPGIGSSRDPEDSRSYFSQLPCKVYGFLKKNPSTTARVKWSYISISQ